MSQTFDGSAAAGLTDTEFDRLADYLGDALDHGESLEIERLIATDAHWHDAHVALAAADDTVRQVLADSALAEQPMPADISSRMDNVLRELVRRPNVSSLDEARARRRPRFARATAIAAAVVLLAGGAGIGVKLLQEGISARSTTTSADAGGAGTAAGAPQAPLTSQGQPTLLASGRDYTESTLRQLAGNPLFSAAAVPAQPEAADSAGKASEPSALSSRIRDAAPVELRRLLDADTLAQCFDAIRVTQPGVVVVADYAQFEGSPALVVLVRQAASSLAVVVGPNCGPAGADQRASAQVG